jgi:hypothetical protein
VAQDVASRKLIIPADQFSTGIVASVASYIMTSIRTLKEFISAEVWLSSVGKTMASGRTQLALTLAAEEAAY